MESRQRALVLHRLPYRETSLLLDLFTEQQGRIRLVALGARRRRSTLQGCLQVFTPLQIQWRGTGGTLQTLRQAEALSLSLPLTGRALYSALYINELLCRLLVPDVSYEALFGQYLQTLCQLAASDGQYEPILRCFEFALLQALGYGVDFQRCAATGTLVQDQVHYRYQAEYGFVTAAVASQDSFSGQQLRALAAGQLSDAATLRAAKIFSRLAFKPYLGARPLKSRELFY
ncbi:DNA repair protein RecO [unidentified bacterial endosymbiont]|uniref:DNA repair protein RecO n=1 Tax=unidentified bacterial endosymbiont TaxID=2355 RepID=UPI0020A06DF6|nr:DNA repair protein RecO [unidentified bacterial endosymbiont]